MMVDTHCHLHMGYYDGDRDAVLKRMEDDGFAFALTVGIDVEDSERAVELAKGVPFLFASVGIHPHDAVKCSDDALERLKLLAEEPKVVSVGEIGLDFYRNLSPKQEQFRAFEMQLELAKNLGLPVVIHTRSAHRETLGVLKRFAGTITGVIHCFSGGRIEAKSYLDLGFYISFAGHVTYPKNEELREVARYVPEDRLLIETDAPFLTPVPLRGKRNEPSYVVYTASKVAELRGVDTDRLFEVVLENAKNLWSVDI